MEIGCGVSEARAFEAAGVDDEDYAVEIRKEYCGWCERDCWAEFAMTGSVEKGVGGSRGLLSEDYRGVVLGAEAVGAKGNGRCETEVV